MIARPFLDEIAGKPAIVEDELDPDLRDTEQVPLLEDGGIEAFIRREVLPYAADDEPLHQQREATPGLGPGHAHLFDAMRWTLHARNLCVEVRFKLAGVQMPPRPWLRMIKRRQLGAAFGTRPPGGVVLQPVARRASRPSSARPA